MQSAQGLVMTYVFVAVVVGYTVEITGGGILVVVKGCNVTVGGQ